jgi:hypothetical protein
MEADFGATGNPADANVDLPQERRQFAEFSIDGQSVRWTLLRGQARIRFEGTREGDVFAAAPNKTTSLANSSWLESRRASRATQLLMQPHIARTPAT